MDKKKLRIVLFVVVIIQVVIVGIQIVSFGQRYGYDNLLDSLFGG